MNENYYIDKNVLQILLQTQDESFLDEFYINYMKITTDLVKDTMEVYLKEKGYDQGKIDTIFSIMDKEAETDADASKSPLKNILNDLELQNTLSQAINLLNKSIYEKHKNNLPEEEKLKLSSYLITIKSVTKNSLDLMLKVLELGEKTESTTPEAPTAAPAQAPTQTPGTPTPAPTTPTAPMSINFTKTE